MIIYPAIELQNGRCVSLYRGRLDEPEIWHVDPVEKARSFADAGAEWIHVTDFDGVAGGDGNNEILQNIIDQAGAPVQLGGGYRSIQQIEDWIERGAGRIVVGTLAILQPDVVKEAAKRFPDQIVIAVDVFKGRIMSDGWRVPSAIEPKAFIKTFERDPLAAFIVSDIDANLQEAENSLSLITDLAGIANAPVIARGLSRTMDDLSRLKYVPHVSGAIVSRALFDHSVSLDEAFDLAKPEREEIAGFQ